MVTDPLFEPGSPPAREVIRRIIGPAATLWDSLVTGVEAMGARGTFTWEGPKYGWSLKYKRAGRPFVTLLPKDGGFTALVILGRAQVEEVPALPLSTQVRADFHAARQYPDGRWLFIPVETVQDVADVVTMLETKLPPTIRAKMAAAR